MITNPTVDKVKPLVQALYTRNTVGCCLHIVLDDGNMKDSHVEFCRDYATKQGHADCLELARLLLQMSVTQRNKLYRHWDDLEG